MPYRCFGAVNNFEPGYLLLVANLSQSVLIFANMNETIDYIMGLYLAFLLDWLLKMDAFILL